MIIDTKNIYLPFVGRVKEIDTSLKFIKSITTDHERKELFVLGESGTGKTTFIEELLNQLSRSDDFRRSNFIYFDTFHTTNDEYSNNMFFQILLYYVWHPKKYVRSNKSKIEKGLSYSRYLKSKFFRSDSIKAVYNTVRTSLSFIPHLGNNLQNIIPKDLDIHSSKLNNFDYELSFAEYLNFITKKHTQILILDNIQFMTTDNITKLKNALLAVDKNLVFILIYRIEDKENKTQNIKKYLWYEQCNIIEIEKFTKKEIGLLFEKRFSNSKENNSLVNDCYNITKGNLKEVEQYIYFIENKDKNIIADNYSSIIISNIGNLSQAKKNILFLASLFPTGLQLKYVIAIIRKHSVKNSMKEFEEDLNFLIKYELIILNGEDKNLIKPSHEKVQTASVEYFNEEDILELRRSCIDVFKKALSQKMKYSPSEFIQLVNNLLGIQKIYEIRKDIKYIIQLFEMLNSGAQFKALLFFYYKIAYDEEEKFTDSLLSLLPSYIMNYLLNTFQKTSDFYEGLNLIQYLKNLKTYDDLETLKLFEARYFVQLYKYNKAQKLLSDNLKNTQFLCLYLNLLQHMRKDSEVRSKIEKLLIEEHKYIEDEFYIIILRNSGHLFKPTIAINNLKKCILYFKDKGNPFGTATSINNLGLVYLYQKEYQAAQKYFEKSNVIFKEISSNEIYQPTFNLGLSYLLQSNYISAKFFFDKALKIVPDSLEFDKCKFLNNIYICEFLNEETSLNHTIHRFMELLNKHAKQMPDPWLNYQVSFNLGVLNTLAEDDNIIKKGQQLIKKAIKEYTGDGDIYGIKHQYTIGSKTVSIILSISPHWRY